MRLKKGSLRSKEVILRKARFIGPVLLIIGLVAFMPWVKNSGGMGQSGFSFITNSVAVAADRSEKSSAPSTGSSHLSKRIKLIGTFINISSGAKRIIQTNNQAAKKHRGKAVELYKQAISAYEAGDNAKSSELLGQAWKQMFIGIKLTKTNASMKEKKAKDFKALLKSVNGLLKAQKRSHVEKNGKSFANNVENQANTMVEEAVLLFKADKLDKAQNRLREAFDIVSASLSEMKQGETKAHLLIFETKEEEFIYEKDKNDSLHTLVEEMIIQKKPGKRRMARIKEFVEKGESIRREAEKQATASEYEAAIDLLEKSNKQFIRAIRSAGIYIPG